MSYSLERFVNVLYLLLIENHENADKFVRIHGCINLKVLEDPNPSRKQDSKLT